MNATEMSQKKTIVTAAQIVSHRATRKATGMLGCLLTGVEDAPLMSLRGICWRVDAKGRFGDHPEFDAKDPGCFCFDCRGMFDPDGTVDAELVNAGHEAACWVYENLLPEKKQSENPTAESNGNSSVGFLNQAPGSKLVTTN